ncbi:G8 domain-containing protein, partial [Klebsiella aerogenes]|uniref:G8 domain-containing protein n=1 Tax=Klebsiella aerogenes TaxID=548 RepID=UPI001CC75EF3
MQFIIGDSPLTLNVAETIKVNGTFQLGTEACPITSQITLFMPGGSGLIGITAQPGSKYDVHGATTGIMWTRISSTVMVGSQTLN